MKLLIKAAANFILGGRNFKQLFSRWNMTGAEDSVLRKEIVQGVIATALEEVQSGQADAGLRSESVGASE